MNFVTSVGILCSFAWQSLIALPPLGATYWRIVTIYRWPALDLKGLEGVSRSPAMSHFSDSWVPEGSLAGVFGCREMALELVSGLIFGAN